MRTNAVPVAILWVLAIILIAAYYAVPQVAEWLEPVADWQVRWGWKGAFCSCAFFCGVIPYFVYRFAGRARQVHPFRIAAAQTLWCGFHGVICNWFFHIQIGLFGAGHDPLTIIAKIIADQFGWSVLVIVPTNAVFYAVVAGGLRIGSHSKEALRSLFWRSYVPTLLSGWCFGIPSCLAVYSFPPALQIHVLGLMSACGVIVCAGIGSRFRCGSDGSRTDSLALSCRTSA